MKLLLILYNGDIYELNKCLEYFIGWDKVIVYKDNPYTDITDL